MDTSNACPTEDAIQVFLDYLVEPLLPVKYSIRETPTVDKQKAVAKQVYAVVLLYNYYHRKRHPHLEYLDFEAFCKLALVVKPNLKSYMKLMLRSDDIKLSDLENQLSLTEKAIKDACDVSTSLDAPSTKGWPISKVAVLLIDLREEKCYLQNGSITEGVWSVIEKDVNELCRSSDGSSEARHMNKRKRISKKHLQDELGADEGRFHQFAFSAVKEAIHDGISQDDLTIIESHVVRSLSEEKTATCFYIMQCIRAEKEIAQWIPIKDVIDSLQGPLLRKSSFQWTYTSVVEYFLLLPYARIIFQRFLRDVLPNGIQDQESILLDVIGLNGSQMTSCEQEVRNNRNSAQINGVVEAFRNGSSAESENRCVKNENCTIDFLDAIAGPWNMDVDNHSMDSEKMLACKNVAEKVQQGTQLKMVNSCVENDLNGMTNAAKFEAVGSKFQNLNHLKGKYQNVANKKAAWNNMPSCQDGIPVNNQALVVHESNSAYSAKLQNVIASKEHILSETAFRVLLSKRDKLVLQQRSIGDEIAQIDKKIQTILNGGKDVLELKIDLIIEGCNDLCRESARQESTPHDYEDQFSSSYIKRNMSEEALSKQNPCQELDDICNKKNWILPTYQVFPSDGGYQATVSVKGMNFESSSVGDVCPKPPEARGSAATQMLAKLHSMSSPFH
ncbi:hypothetical protein PTKIN_Ptkin09bG0249400 [Pterospermum kingtungense]